MPHTSTHFDISRNHIHIRFFVTDYTGQRHSLDGVLDTGAPRSEFSDKFLVLAGFIKTPVHGIVIKQGLQTQKYGKLVLPKVEICNHLLENFEVFASRFDDSWGIAALIGLDFFRKFRTTIDYGRGEIIAEPLTII